MNIVNLLNNDEIARAEEIHKGWSTDKKYYILLKNGQELLLRMAPIDQFTRKATEFDWMKELFLKGMPISEPLDIKGVEDEVFSLFAWVEGKDLADILPSLSEETQYQLGVASGEYLKQMHGCKAPADTEKWEKSFNRKIDRTIQRYLDCPEKYEKGDLFLAFIEQHRHLIKDRPATFQHGDYHTGNMILSAEKELGIIDFNRWDYGDPWEEFNRIDFTAEASPVFATGQLNGYFSGQPPVGFFSLMLIYISTNTLSALPWALNYSEIEVTTMRNKATKILDWYDEMKSIIPSWYDKEAIEKYGI